LFAIICRRCTGSGLYINDMMGNISEKTIEIWGFACWILSALISGLARLGGTPY